MGVGASIGTDESGHRVGFFCRLRSFAFLLAALVMLGGLQPLLASSAAAHAGTHHQIGAQIAIARSGKSVRSVPRGLSVTFCWQARQDRSITAEPLRCPNHCGDSHGVDGTCCATGCGAAIESDACTFDGLLVPASRLGIPQQPVAASAFTSVVPRPPNHVE